MLRDFSSASSVRRCAAASPAMPPPMTTTRFMKVQVEDGRSRIEDCDLPSSILDPRLLNLGFNDIGDHAHKSRMIVGAAGADEVDAQVLGDFFRFDVQIVKHFDMVADKTDGCDDDFFAPFGGESRMASPMSGSSQGSLGLPLRL